MSLAVLRSRALAGIEAPAVGVEVRARHPRCIGQIPSKELDRYEFACERSLSGQLRPIRGALAMTFTMQPSAGGTARSFIPPQVNANEAALVSGAAIYPAIEVAAAGVHSVLLIGPSGTGMLPLRFAGLLPPMSDEEALESAGVQSLASGSRWNAARRALFAAPPTPPQAWRFSSAATCHVQTRCRSRIMACCSSSFSHWWGQLFHHVSPSGP